MQKSKSDLFFKLFFIVLGVLVVVSLILEVRDYFDHQKERAVANEYIENHDVFINTGDAVFKENDLAIKKLYWLFHQDELSYIVHCILYNFPETWEIEEQGDITHSVYVYDDDDVTDTAPCSNAPDDGDCGSYVVDTSVSNGSTTSVNPPTDTYVCNNSLVVTPKKFCLDVGYEVTSSDFYVYYNGKKTENFVLKPKYSNYILTGQNVFTVEKGDLSAICYIAGIIS